MSKKGGLGKLFGSFTQGDLKDLLEMDIPDTTTSEEEEWTDDVKDVKIENLFMSRRKSVFFNRKVLRKYEKEGMGRVEIGIGKCDSLKLDSSGLAFFLSQTIPIPKKDYRKEEKKIFWYSTDPLCVLKKGEDILTSNPFSLAPDCLQDVEWKMMLIESEVGKKRMSTKIDSDDQEAKKNFSTSL